MALQQSRINEIYPNRKPFMESIDGKRKAGKDLRVQTLIAQETAKRQCSGLDQPAEQDAHAQQQHFVGIDTGRDPTDFKGFFSQLQQEKQQHGSDPAQQQQQQLTECVGVQREHQQQPASVLTLDELLSHHELHSRDRPPTRQLQQMVSLERVLAADSSRDGFVRGLEPLQPQQQHSNTTNSGDTGMPSAPGAAACGPRHGQAAPAWHLTQLLGVPWDWSVKASVRVSAAVPFAVLEEAREADMEAVCRAVVAAGAGGGDAGAAAAEPSSQERLARALMQWQHPAGPLPPALLAGQGGGIAAIAAAAAAGAGAAAAQAAASDPRGDAPAAAAAALLRERVQVWRTALRGAYIALRHGHCPVLYVCGQAFRQHFTAVLFAPGIMGSGSSSSSRITAVVSRTNRQLRAHLAEYGAEGVLAGHAEHGMAGDAQQQQQQQQLPAGAFDGQPGSQLLLCGAMPVHGLYAALLALPWCSPDMQDVPLLCAPVPFAHAQLCSLRLEVLPDAVLEQQQQQHKAGAAAGGAGAPQPLHYAELRPPGPVMPWTLHRLLVLLQDTQGPAGGFQAYLRTEPSCSSLNLLPELWQGAEAGAAAVAAAAAGGDPGCLGFGFSVPGGRARQQQQQQQPWQLQGRGFSREEVAAWGEAAALLQGRVLRQLQLDADGSLAACLA